MTIRVLMLGPGEALVGGISTLVETILPALRQEVDLLYLPTVRQRLQKESGRISLRNFAAAVSQYARFLWSLHHFRPHIIHVHTSQGIAWLKDTFFVLMGKLYGCCVVLHMHGGSFDLIYEKNTRLVRLYTNRVIRLSDAVIVLSAEWERRLKHVIPNEQVHILRNCVAVDNIAPHSFDPSTNGVMALFLGNVGLNKGVFDLLQSMSHVKLRGIPLRLWVAGGEEREGDLFRARKRLEELRLEDTCQLLGEVRGERKAKLLGEARLFVLPSYQEGLPMAILEAMAAGLPVIATSVGGIPEVVKDGYNGFLVAPGDIEALAEKLALLASDSHLCGIMGERSHEFAVRELDVKPYIKRLVALYEVITN
jgi:glycosyltransferase involved in cell wall biosynthesis